MPKILVSCVQYLGHPLVIDLEVRKRGPGSQQEVKRPLVVQLKCFADMLSWMITHDLLQQRNRRIDLVRPARARMFSKSADLSQV